MLFIIENSCSCVTKLKHTIDVTHLVCLNTLEIYNWAFFVAKLKWF